MSPETTVLRAEQLSTPPKDTGFTLGKLFNKNLLILVKPPLPLDALYQLTGTPHRSGTPPELLTPGDAGIAVHVRW